MKSEDQSQPPQQDGSDTQCQEPTPALSQTARNIMGLFGRDLAQEKPTVSSTVHRPLSVLLMTKLKSCEGSAH